MLKFRYFVRKALKLTFFLIVILSVVSFFLNSNDNLRPFIPFTWISLFFFLFLTLFSGYYNSRSIKKPFFFNIFFGTLGVKFILSIAFFAAYYLLLYPEKMLVIPFFLLFMIFKVFETYMLLKYSRSPSPGFGEEGEWKE